jgi:hypothetical protein
VNVQKKTHYIPTFREPTSAPAGSSGGEITAMTMVGGVKYTARCGGSMRNVLGFIRALLIGRATETIETTISWESGGELDWIGAK